MSEFKVEKNVPIPTSPRKGADLKYPWPEMEAGDSFFVPVTGEEKKRVRGRLAVGADKWLNRNRPDLKYTLRSVDGGIRIWFIEK